MATPTAGSTRCGQEPAKPSGNTSSASEESTSSPVLDGTTVYISHSEENPDRGTMGRVVAIDATGMGDVTATHERWRADEVAIGFSSPLIRDGILYVIDNSANLIGIDATSGEELWEHSVGTVGKASPVWADGKLYVNETNGNVHILQPSRTGVTVLDSDRLEIDGGRHAEIYGIVRAGLRAALLHG